MSEEVTRRFKTRVPEGHRANADTRLVWLWEQRFGTVQSIWTHSPDPLDKMACNILLQCALLGHLDSIELAFKRLEGGAQVDTIVEETTRI